MIDKANVSGDHLNEVLNDAKKRVSNSLRFHLRAWKSNAEAVKNQGRKVLVDFMEQEVKRLDSRVEQVAWHIHRPISWLTQKISQLDDKRVAHFESAKKVQAESKLQEDEVPRLLDEGGPVPGSKAQEGHGHAKTS